MGRVLVRLTKEQVQQGEHHRFDPDRHEFQWDADFSECVVVTLDWWDESSYLKYQGDGDEQRPVDP